MDNYDSINVTYQAHFQLPVKTINLDEEVYFEKAKEYVSLTRMTFKCFKLTSKMETKVKKGDFKFVTINTYGYSSEIEIFFTSEANAYGAISDIWYEGKHLGITLSADEKLFMGIRQEKYTYLDYDSQCSHMTYYELLGKYLSNVTDFGQCPRKCLPYLLPTKDMPICGWNYEDQMAKQCAQTVVDKAVDMFEVEGNYSRPCKMIQYTGEPLWRNQNNEQGVATIGYQFQPPQLALSFEEYLTFDTVGFIGAVGGTLGMCIGFSFHGLISSMIDMMEIGIQKFRLLD